MLLLLFVLSPGALHAQYGCNVHEDCGDNQTCISGVCVDNDGFCGDNTCNNGETQATCPWDCGYPPSQQFCGTITCPGGGTGNVICDPGCSLSPRACWDDCGPGGGGNQQCSQASDCTGTVNCGYGTTCGEWACGNGACYSDCSGCTAPPSGCTPTTPAAAQLSAPANGSVQDTVSPTDPTKVSVSFSWSTSTWGQSCSSANRAQMFIRLQGSASWATGCFIDYGVPTGGSPTPLSMSCPGALSTLERGRTYEWKVRLGWTCLIVVESELQAANRLLTESIVEYDAQCLSPSLTNLRQKYEGVGEWAEIIEDRIVVLELAKAKKIAALPGGR